MTRALRLIPLAGWAFLLAGLVRPYRSRVLQLIFWVDVVLSVGAHAAQIPAALRVAEPLGHSRRRVVVSTMIYGATWWRPLRGQL
ncbi:hypothetical protein [Nocardia stercoris]|uniref:Uncharacterized protein n=1 Tax=Nocardia stercoris TaxID=2483361 RepID=A0A3M2LKN9_9NOCA|nr:hypothetical protein [Nocardia stercoris]RMI35348.1 hypothetical protein EBN03_03445 [Nocardia stercoris]